MHFTPFSHPIGLIDVDDLLALRDVPEGWYVEYKESVSSPKAIAKSLGSFANTYGGWIMYGVAEARLATECLGFAGTFPGFSEADVPNALAKIANAARLLNPVPFYETQVVTGTSVGSDSGSLLQGQVVLVVRVPEGVNAPYIHPDGRVYRRVADQSDPTAETNRAVFDALHARSKSARKRLSKIIRARPELSAQESGNPYLQLHFFSDRYADPSSISKLEFADFCEIAKAERFGDQLYAISFDSFFASATGYVARQLMGNPAYSAVLTVTHDLNGTTSALVPMRTIASVQHDQFTRLIQVCQHLSSVRVSVDLNRMLDLNHLFAVVVAIFHKHVQFCNRGDVRRPVFAKAELFSVWRMTPFLDTDAYAQFVAENGPAVIQYRDVIAPAGVSPESLRELATPLEVADDSSAIDINAFRLVVDILNALGIPRTGFIPDGDESDEGDESLLAALTDIFSAVQRATAASRSA